MKSLKKLFTQTRLPYLLGLIVVTCGIFFEINTIQHDNLYANRTLNQWHAENVVKIHKNQQKIFNYRTQLNALSDEKNTYLSRSMMEQIVRAMWGQKDWKKVHFPNLTKDPEYKHIDANDMKISDYDSDRINSLSQDIDADEMANKYDHNHSWVENAMNPQKSQSFADITYNGAGAGILLIIDFIILVRMVDFRHMQTKKQEHAELHAEKAKLHAEKENYIKEYGDLDGFKES